MKMTMALLFCAVLALGLAACGEDEGAGKYVGTYQVTHHTLNDGACDAEGPAVTDGAPYFKIEKADFFGFPILNIHDCTGRLVRTLATGELKAAGAHAAIWDGADERGRALPAGIYLCHIIAGSGSAHAKLCIVR